MVGGECRVYRVRQDSVAGIGQKYQHTGEHEECADLAEGSHNAARHGIGGGAACNVKEVAEPYSAGTKQREAPDVRTAADLSVAWVEELQLQLLCRMYIK